MTSCSPCPAIDTIGPGRLKTSFWTPPMVNKRRSKELVAAAAHPWPRQMASTSSFGGMSTIHSLLESQELRCRQWSLLKIKTRQKQSNFHIWYYIYMKLMILKQNQVTKQSQIVYFSSITNKTKSNSLFLIS